MNEARNVGDQGHDRGRSRTSFTIREAGTPDIPVLVEFNRAMAAETESKALDRDVLTAGVRAIFEDPSRGRYFLATEKDAAGRRGRAVGALLVTYEWSDWRNAVFWWIQSVYVPPSDRRRSVFRALYEFLLERARTSRGVCGLRLYVERENEAAQAVYQSLGMFPSSYQMFELDFVFGGQDRPPVS